jgi:uncharacterized protein YbjT (DUF2867 family)
MRTVVVGGHGRTGILVVEQLLKDKHDVVATIRNPKHMADLVKRGAETVVLDLDDTPFDEWVHAFKGADSVVFAAGSGTGESSEIDRKGTLRTLRAANKAGVKRYVSISALGASTGLSTRSMSDEMKDYYKQKRLGGKAIEKSGLDYTILEPGGLTDEPGTGKVKLSVAAIEEDVSIPRADVAAAVAAVLKEPKSVGKTFQLVSGTTAIATAVKKASA